MPPTIALAAVRAVPFAGPPGNMMDGVTRSRALDGTLALSTNERKKCTYR